MKKFLRIIGAAALALVMCFAITACGNSSDNGEVKKEETVEGFTVVWNYESYAFNGGSLDYAVYKPPAYSESGTALPLVCYVPDATYDGKPIENVVRATGAKQWITEENMTQEPAIFLVMAPGKSTIAHANDVIDTLIEKLNIDTNRLYLTGQSGGGIMDWLLNEQYPNKFAATVYVGCQPGDEVNDENYDRIMTENFFFTQKFVYISSRCDAKASSGQDDITAIFDENNIEYCKDYTLDKNNMTATIEKVNTLFENNSNVDKFFLGFTYVQNGQYGDSMEHTASFAYCYQVSCLYNWLMAQRLN